MQVTETSAEGLKREYRIVVSAGDLESEIDRRLGEISKSIRLPGFRPGKVPMNLLKTRFGNAVRGEVLESQVQASSAEAMQQNNLRPALPPRVEIVSAAEGTDLEYKMSVEVLPELPELKFDDLGLEKLIAEIPKEDVDKALDRMAEQYRKSEAVEREAKTEDLVGISFVGKIDGVEFPGGKGDNITLTLGSGQFIPGFEDQLVGAKGGDDREVKVTFPADYGVPDLAGKDAVFEVKVNEVRERAPAVVDDHLAEEVGLENLTELRDEIEGRMRRDYDGVARQRLKRELLDKLAERYSFEVPPGMVEMEFATIMQQYESEKAAQKARAEQNAEPGAAEGAEEGAQEGARGDDPPAEAAAETETEDEEKTKAEFRQIAERRVRLGLLLAEVGRTNNISVSQDEINQALTREARNHPGYERQVIEYYRSNPDAVSNLRGPIYEEKVVDFVVELAKLSERKVTPLELLSLPEPDADAEKAEPEENMPARREKGEGEAEEATE
ncbi:MAG TPA: trigger factor [Stellaceae bacterium]|jgi:trigger factor